MIKVDYVVTFLWFKVLEEVNFKFLILFGVYNNGEV